MKIYSSNFHLGIYNYSKMYRLKYIIHSEIGKVSHLKNRSLYSYGGTDSISQELENVRSLSCIWLNFGNSKKFE